LDRKFPIIYVRGFAFSADERDETAADPFCGFNVGSTVVRATANKERPASYIFESPLVRLATEHDYSVMYHDGIHILDPAWGSGPAGVARVKKGIPVASLIIHRYYDSGSTLFGNGKSSSIADYAIDLARLIALVRVLVRPHAVVEDPTYKDAKFKCYLVAHSMGGLVVRALLENPKNDVDQLYLKGEPGPPSSVRGCVAKVFTYATPHNGIDLAGFNVPKLPGFLRDASTFNRDVMREYLAKPESTKVNLLPVGINPPPSHWFCMVGTNRLDYEVAHGASRVFAGKGSDGLVRIENAVLWARSQTDVKGKLVEREVPVGCAYAYRSHSGMFGIVNSEEAYQNLARFLFGNYRVELWLDIQGVDLPSDVKKQEDAGETVDAVYQVELAVSTRGKTWYLSRRKAEEDSPACRTYKQLRGIEDGASESVHLSTIFMAKAAKADETRAGVSYSVTLGVRSPDYEVGDSFFGRDHYEGLSLFRDSLIVTIYDPDELKKEAIDKGLPPPAGGAWKVTHRWLRGPAMGGIPPGSAGSPGTAIPVVETSHSFSPEDISKNIVVAVDLHADLATAETGRIKAKLRMEASGWQ
jgi:pimeloyl-ACP methyl ester carboxylesterase